MNQAEEEDIGISVELEAALLSWIFTFPPLQHLWEGLREITDASVCNRLPSLLLPRIQQLRDAVHHAWMVINCGFSFSWWGRGQPISCRLRGLWAAGKSISRGRENGGHRHCSKTPTTTGHLAAYDVETDDGHGYHTLAMCRQENDNTLRMELC